jgi:hypothetical protein
VIKGEHNQEGEANGGHQRQREEAVEENEVWALRRPIVRAILGGREFMPGFTHI